MLSNVTVSSGIPTEVSGLGEAAFDLSATGIFSGSTEGGFSWTVRDHSGKFKLSSRRVLTEFDWLPCTFWWLSLSFWILSANLCMASPSSSTVAQPRQHLELRSSSPCLTLCPRCLHSPKFGFYLSHHASPLSLSPFPFLSASVIFFFWLYFRMLCFHDSLSTLAKVPQPEISFSLAVWKESHCTGVHPNENIVFVATETNDLSKN